MLWMWMGVCICALADDACCQRVLIQRTRRQFRIPPSPVFKKKRKRKSDWMPPPRHLLQPMVRLSNGGGEEEATQAMMRQLYPRT
jgi:hypothetical protein